MAGGRKVYSGAIRKRSLIREVISTTVGIFGIMGNILAIVVLSQKGMRNTFNKLLIALSVFDILLLFHAVLWGATMETSRPISRDDLLFSYFLSPLKNFSMAGSILMVTAIAVERFMAIHYPYRHSR